MKKWNRKYCGMITGMLLCTLFLFASGEVLGKYSTEKRIASVSLTITWEPEKPAEGTDNISEDNSPEKIPEELMEDASPAEETSGDPLPEEEPSVMPGTETGEEGESSQPEGEPEENPGNETTGNLEQEAENGMPEDSASTPENGTTEDLESAPDNGAVNDMENEPADESAEESKPDSGENEAVETPEEDQDKESESVTEESGTVSVPEKAETEGSSIS